MKPLRHHPSLNPRTPVMQPMIDLYYWPTPNGHKITIFLEETGTPYRIVPVNIGARRAVQARTSWRSRRTTACRRSSTPSRPTAVRRSRSSNRARSCSISPRKPADSCRPTCAARFDVLQWLFWQMGGLGPMAGQNHHFTQYAPEKLPYAIDRYVKRDRRACTPCWTSGSPTATSSPATIRSPTWRLSLDRSARAAAAGPRRFSQPEALVRMPSARGLRWCGRTRKAKPSTPSRRSTKSRANSCSDRPRRRYAGETQKNGAFRAPARPFTLITL